MKKLIITISMILLLAIGIRAYQLKQSIWSDSFKAPGNNWDSPKKVEDYFIDSLRMTPEEAKIADNGVAFYITKNATYEGVVSNLVYYGLARDQRALKYALEHTKDTVLGEDDAIKVGEEGTIDLAYYDLSREMDAWQIADVLLNKPHPIGRDPYNYLFMPGKPKSPYDPRTEE